MKLKYWRTICVGFAFFLITIFWQAYDSIIPKILTDKFGMSQTGSGAIMALDNVLALFMLPLFGAISDRTRTRFGKRTPFIVVGTIVAAVALVCLTFVDNAQLAKIDPVTKYDSSTLTVLYNDSSVVGKTLKTNDGDEYIVNELFTEEQFTSITTETYMTVKDNKITIPVEKDADGAVNAWTEYVTPARQAYAAEVASNNHRILIAFIAVLLVILVSMSIFRSPAVALMPDVTIKPLRSKANAIINLMGSLGGIIFFVLGMLFGTGKVTNALMSYTVFFAVIAGIMLIALVAFLLTVRENKFVEEMEEESRRYGIDNDAVDDGSGDRKLSKPELRSLLLILASVALWYFGYNAITSKYSVYASDVLKIDYNSSLMVSYIAGIISYLPIGIISSKIGRKKTILAGVVILAFAFFAASFMRAGSPALIMTCLFALAGIGWATINVNSFPMVVELAKGGTVGKYTGYYYTASMAAQAITPIFSGFLMDTIGKKVLFIYGTVFVALAFVTMLFVRHGDNKPTAKAGLEAFDVED